MSRTLRTPQKNGGGLVQMISFFHFNLGVFFKVPAVYFQECKILPNPPPQQPQPPLRALTKAVEKRESSRNSPPKATTVRMAYKLSCFCWIKGKPASNGGLG